MRCLSPTRIKNPKYGSSDDEPYFISVPCNKCYSCLANRRRGWLLRLMVESCDHNYTYFLTLTYSDDFNDGNLHKEHLQRYLKALNRKFGIRYYAIGEYGTHTLRPHYHAIIFTDSDLDSYISTIDWPFGFHLLSKSVPARLNYILHYHTRPKLPKELSKKGLTPSFALMSKNLGLRFLTDDLVDYLKNRHQTYIHYQGETYVLPRYYRKKFEISPDLVGDLPSTRSVLNEKNHRVLTDTEFESQLLEYFIKSEQRKNKYNYQITNV